MKSSYYTVDDRSDCGLLEIEWAGQSRAPAFYTSGKSVRVRFGRPYQVDKLRPLFSVSVLRCWGFSAAQLSPGLSSLGLWEEDWWFLWGA